MGDIPMKCRNLFLLGMNLLIAPIILNCQSLTGIYTHAQTVGDYLEFKSDGTFFMHITNKQSAGKYEINDKEINLIFKEGNSLHGTIINDTITDGNGENWYLWHGGKTSADYEIKYREANSKIRELHEKNSKASSDYRDHDRKRYDILVDAGLISREAADRQLRIKENQDGITSSLVNIAANAYQYRVHPTTMDGGGGRYDGYVIPDKMMSDDYGAYKLEMVDSQSIQLKGTSTMNKSWFVIANLDSTGKVGVQYSESGWK